MLSMKQNLYRFEAGEGPNRRACWAANHQSALKILNVREGEKFKKIDSHPIEGDVYRLELNGETIELPFNCKHEPERVWKEQIKKGGVITHIKAGHRDSFQFA